MRILATLGPASDSPQMIRRLVEAGADAFRINMSHGSHADHEKRIAAIRALEAELDRPTTILADLQGPKLRVGKFKGDKAELKNGQAYRLRPRRRRPATRPARTCRTRRFSTRPSPACGCWSTTASSSSGSSRSRADRIEAKVEVGGTISNNKGLNVPDVVLPLAALTEKDRADLAFALDQHVDWIALSFVQRPEDVAEARRLIGGKANLLAKIEKPAAIERLDGILELADAVMVARGDLGVEMPPEQVPPLQKRIVEAARRMGRPVVVATQMLESMITSPSPTRAEVSDVATAVYDGADAIMLSAESASGQFPVRVGRDDEPDRDQRGIATRAIMPASISPRPCRTRPPTTPSPGRPATSCAPSAPRRSSASPARARPPGGSRASGRPCRCWC